MKNTTTAVTYTILKPERKTPPTVLFTSKALKWIEAIIDNHDTEIGFYGVVEEDETKYAFCVTDIFYPKHQMATSCTCEISPEGEALIMNYLVEKNRVSDINKMMLWGHSHHTMGVVASTQDEKQAIERMEATKHHIIRIIVNKEKLMSVSFFDYKQQLKFDNVVWAETDINNEPMNIKTLDQIQKVLSSDMDSKKKLIEIDRIMYTDEEMEEIIEKVKKLKEVNIPTSITTYPPYTPPYYGRDFSNFDRGGYTPSLDPKRFPKLSKFPKHNHHKVSTTTGPLSQLKDQESQEELFPFQEGVPLTEQAATAEVESLMKEWDGEEF